MKEICDKKMNKYSPLSQGIISFKLGRDRNSCPFPDGSPQFEVWQSGWTSCSQNGKMATHNMYENIFK